MSYARVLQCMDTDTVTEMYYCIHEISQKTKEAVRFWNVLESNDGFITADSNITGLAARQISAFLSHFF